jgi:hypothetical protein
VTRVPSTSQFQSSFSNVAANKKQSVPTFGGNLSKENPFNQPRLSEGPSRRSALNDTTISLNQGQTSSNIELFKHSNFSFIELMKKSNPGSTSFDQKVEALPKPSSSS